MKILICSDSHGAARNLIAAAERTKPDYFLFLGDGMRDFAQLRRRFPRLPAEAVRGNCDYLASEAEQRLLDLAGVKLFLAHGHKYGVKQELGLMKREARRQGARIMLFGHTHRPYYSEEEGLFLFNPGSAGDPVCPSCGLLELSHGMPRFEHIKAF